MQPSVLLQLNEFKHWHVSLQLIPYLPYGHSKILKNLILLCNSSNFADWYIILY